MGGGRPVGSGGSSAAPVGAEARLAEVAGGGGAAGGGRGQWRVRAAVGAGAGSGGCGRRRARAHALAAAGAGAGAGACASKGWEEEGIRWIRWAGPLLWWIGWAGLFLWAFLLFSPYSMTIDLLFFLFFQVLKYVLIN